jgi:hypothetical protein
VYTVLVSGYGLTPGSLHINSSSPWIQIKPETIRSISFGTDTSALSFDVEVSKDALEGDYSLFVTNLSGSGLALIGPLTVEKYPNILSQGLSSN